MGKRTYIPLEKIVVGLVLCISIGWDLVGAGGGSGFESNVFRFIKVLLSLGLVFIASKPRFEVFDRRVLIGLLASFFAPAFLSVSPAEIHFESSLGLPLFLAAILFYSLIAVLGILTLRRNFGILPALRQVVSGGVYSLVRHPVYSCYIHLVVLFVLTNPSIWNLFVLIVFYLGLHLRIGAEERVLSEVAEYRVYKEEVKYRLFSIFLSFPLLVVSVSLFADAFLKPQPLVVREMKVQLGAPVLSINPLNYDDWSSVFVGNHIYPRLLRDEDRPWIPYVAKNLNFKCLGPATDISSAQCTELRVEFRVKEFDDCLGRRVSSDDIKMEIGAILEKKNWIFPKWSFCDSARGAVCIQVQDVGDIRRRLQNIYFRFGWSKKRNGDSRFGVAPYCLDGTKAVGVIESGRLIPRAGSGAGEALPSISFHTSSDPENDFSVALYGAEEFVQGARKNVRAHTPLAYYLVSNRKWSGLSVPWMERDSLDIMKDHLISVGLIYESDVGVLEKMVPVGAVASSGKHIAKATKITVYLPDYIPSCNQLASKLVDRWRSDYPNLLFSCVDISVAVRDHIHSDSSDFGAVLTPLSPGAPGRDAIRYQYFSPRSSESLTRDFVKPELLFRLLGMGDSLVTLDGRIYCGLKGQSLGLGDVFVTDFLKCK